LARGKPSQAKITALGQDLIEHILSAEHAYKEQHKLLYASRTCLGSLTISLVDVLEANAISAELLHLLVAHGVSCARLYHERVVRRLPAEYNRLLNES
jgi:hypothetical protein